MLQNELGIGLPFICKFLCNLFGIRASGQCGFCVPVSPTGPWYGGVMYEHKLGLLDPFSAVYSAGEK